MEAGKYRITDETDGTVLTALDWKTRIKPGTKLSMEMVVEKWAFKRREHSCPACHMIYTGAKTKELERVKWYDIFHPAYILI